MKQLGVRTFWLTDSAGANTYWVDFEDRVAIIDPGMSPGVNPVARELRRAGRSPYEVTDVLLTHYDLDHAQSAALWVERTGARCWLGAADAAILSGAMRPRTTFRQLTANLGLPELPRNLRLLDADTELWPGLVAIHTPGHTSGHFAFHTTEALFCGDAAWVRGRRLGALPKILADAPSQITASARQLAATRTTWVCCGHSAPVRRDQLS